MKVKDFFRSRLFSLFVSTLLVFTFVVTPCEVSAASGGKKTVYVVSSVKVSISEGKYYYSADSFTGKLKYNKNGLLTSYKSNASVITKRRNECYLNCSFTYKGKKLIKERYNSVKKLRDITGYTKQYNYKKGTLKGVKEIYSKEAGDFNKFKCKLNKNGRIKKVTNKYGEHEIYKYDSNGYLIQWYDDVFPDYTTSYTYDTHGNLIEITNINQASPVDSTVVTDKTSAVNTYNNGRLTKTVITEPGGSIITVTVKYAKKKVPKKYYKSVKIQQHDVIARYVHGVIDEIPLGAFK